MPIEAIGADRNLLYGSNGRICGQLLRVPIAIGISLSMGCSFPNVDGCALTKQKKDHANTWSTMLEVMYLFD